MMNKLNLFVTGIGTGIGKTIVSAVLTEKLKADYWKPVQSGDLDNSDTLKVRELISNTKTVFHQEAYRLTQPFSPHKSAAIDGVVIQEEKFVMPVTANHLVIEGAGGLMVPLNDHFLMIDLIKKVDASVVLVSQNYLGSINHTLLSIAALQQRQVTIAGIIFNGKTDDDSENYILKYTKVKSLGHVPELAFADKNTIIDAGNSIGM